MFLKLSMLPPRHGSNSLKLHVMEEEEEEGGGGKQASCLVPEQAVEFPQVLASILYCTIISIEVAGVSMMSLNSLKKRKRPTKLKV